jgi:hypothetical protein
MKNDLSALKMYKNSSSELYLKNPPFWIFEKKNSSIISYGWVATAKFGSSRFKFVVMVDEKWFEGHLVYRRHLTYLEFKSTKN